MSYMEPPQDAEYNEYYRRYVALVPQGDIVGLLVTQFDDTLATLREITEAQAERGYAAGKWTIKEVIGHLADAERVFMYRVMRIARGDATPLESFDENMYAPAGQFNTRPLVSLLAEFTAVRRATVALLAGLPADAWTRAGTASGASVTVRALAWITAGHELHHRAIVIDRYLAVADAASAARL